MKHLLAVLLLMMVKTNASAQIIFQRTYGIGLYNEGRSVKPTFDGGYIIAGSESDAGNGSSDVYLLKIDSLGNFMWHKTFGGSNIDRGYAVEQLNDSGYAIAGYTNSFGSGGYDGYLIRTNKNGDTIWTKTYGTNDWDFILSMKTTMDGGFILAGYTYGNLAGNATPYLVKTDSLGNITWIKTPDMSDDVFIQSVALFPGGGFAVAGYRVNQSDGNENMFVSRLTNSGDTIWTKTIGNTIAYEHANSIDVNFSDSSIIAAGYSKDIASGNYDDYLVKLDANGNLSFLSLFPQPGEEMINDIHGLASGFIVASYTTTFGFGQKDAHYYTVNDTGQYIAGTTHGGTQNDMAYHIEATADGGYILCGSSTSYTPGLQSVYLIKMDSLFQTSSLVIGLNDLPSPAQHFSNYPNPFHDYTVIDVHSFGQKKEVSFSVYNLAGEMVYSTLINTGKEFVFHRDHLPAGLYVYKLTDSEKNHAFGKLVIE
ncbi:MAG: T9SS type A sorting domain-containing protein [Bacteroidetes bacterium]|nr:T9SS type A sorting domain-containing protein [Bacteroidota bacterium]